MAEGKCVGVCQHPGCWEAGKGRKRTDNAFYASVLQNILFKRQANLLNSPSSPETAREEMPYMQSELLFIDRDICFDTYRKFEQFTVSDCKHT